MRNKRAIAVGSVLLSTTAWPAVAMTPAHYSDDPPPAHSTASGNTGFDFVSSSATVRVGDISIGTVGGGMSFSRLYQGSGFRDNVTGTIALSGTDYIVSVGGSSEAFTAPSTTGPYTPKEVNGSTLTLSGTIYTYTKSDGTVFKFDTNRRAFLYPTDTSVWGALLTQIIEPSGRVTDYTYEGTTATVGAHPYQAFRIQSITTTDGYKFTPTYLQSTLTTNDYTTYHWLIKVVLSNLADSSATQSLSIAKGGSGSNTYVDYIVDPSPGLALTTRISFVDGELSALRRPGSGSDDVTFGIGGNAITIVENGVTTTYVPFQNGTLDTAVKHGTTVVRTVQVDQALGRVVSDRLATSDTTGNTTTYSYYATTDAATGKAKGRLQTVTNPEGDSITYKYDVRGNVTSVTRTPKPGSGLTAYVSSATYVGGTNPITMNLPASTTDERGKVTNFAYATASGIGPVTIITVAAPAPTSGADRPQTRSVFTAKSAYYSGSSGPSIYKLTEVSACSTGTYVVGTGNLICDGTATETVTTYTYGSGTAAKNLLPTTLTKASGNSTGTGAVSASTSMTYNALGDVLSVDGPLATSVDTTYFRYDSARRKKGEILPDPDGTGSLLARATQFYYNADSTIAKIENGTDSTPSSSTWTGFTMVDRTTSSWSQGHKTKDALYTAGADRSIVQYYYDNWGRLECTAVRMTPSEWTSLPTTCVQGTTAADRLTKTAYDYANQATSEVTLDASNVAVPLSSKTYNGNGTIATFTDGNNNKTTFTYDGFDRLTRTQYPDGGGFDNATDHGSGSSSSTDVVNTTYTIDSANNYVTTIGRDGLTNIVYYDDLGRLRTRDRPGTETDLTYTYDNLDRLLSVKSATATDDLTFTYDALGRQLTQTASLTSTVTTVATSEYDAAGRRTKLVYDDGLYLTYDYFDNGALRTINENGITPIVSFVYDSVGNRTKTTRLPGTGNSTTYSWNDTGTLQGFDISLPGTANDLNTDFTYNAAQQIASMTRGPAAHPYKWVNDGNVNRTYVRNGKNQYTSTTSTAGGGLTFGYSARGDINTETITGDSQPIAAYTYSSEGFLLTAKRGPGGTTPPSTVATLWYDNLDRLRRAAEAGADTRFRYDGTDLIAEYTTGGTLLRRYVHGPNDDEPLVVYEGSGAIVASTAARTHLYADERGSIIFAHGITSDGTGTTSTLVNTYDEYGIPGDSNMGRFQYTGQTWLAGLKMYYYKARMYSPTLGRFLQTDPIGLDGGINLYGYTGNDPVNGRDPSGLVTTGNKDNPLELAAVHLDAAIIVTANKLPKDPAARFAAFEGALEALADRFERNLAHKIIRFRLQNPQPCSPTPAQLANSGAVSFRFSEGSATLLATSGDAFGTFKTTSGYSGTFHASFDGAFIGGKGFGAAYGTGSSQSLATFKGVNYNLIGTLGPYSISDNFDPNSGAHVGQTDALSRIGLGLGVTRSDTTLVTISCPR